MVGALLYFFRWQYKRGNFSGAITAVPKWLRTQRGGGNYDDYEYGDLVSKASGRRMLKGQFGHQKGDGP